MGLSFMSNEEHLECFEQSSDVLQKSHSGEFNGLVQEVSEIRLVCSSW